MCCCTVAYRKPRRLRAAPRAALPTAAICCVLSLRAVLHAPLAGINTMYSPAELEVSRSPCNCCCWVLRHLERPVLVKCMSSVCSATHLNLGQDSLAAKCTQGTAPCLLQDAVAESKFLSAPAFLADSVLATRLQEYARAKHAGSTSFERHLQSNKAEEEDRKQRNRGYRAQDAAAALQAVTQYGEAPCSLAVRGCCVATAGATASKRCSEADRLLSGCFCGDAVPWTGTWLRVCCPNIGRWISMMTVMRTAFD